MSTRTSIFREIEKGVYYGVYRHHDGYPTGAGADLLDAIKKGFLVEHMNDLYDRYDGEYENYSFDDIMDLWRNSDHEFGYIVYLDGRIEVYDIYFSKDLKDNTIKYMGELKDILA